MFGTEQMVETLVQSLTGMTLDQIKTQMVVVQSKVAETIETFNNNFKTLSDQSTYLHRDHESIIAQIDRVRFEVTGSFHSLTTRLENVSFHLAQISVKLGMDLTPDLLEVITKQATAGTASTFTIPEASDPAGLGNYPPAPGLGGMGVDSSTQSQPEDTQNVVK